MIITRPIVEADAAIIREKFADLFTWRTPQQVMRKVEQALDPSSGQHILVAEVDGAVVAMAAYGTSTVSTSTWNLYLSATLPEFRGRGINRRLIRHRLNRIAQHCPPTAPANVLVSTRRVSTFEGWGFQQIAPNGTTVLMVKHLPATFIDAA